MQFGKYVATPDNQIFIHMFLYIIHGLLSCTPNPQFRLKIYLFQPLFIKIMNFCYDLFWELPQSYCGDETDPKKHSRTSDSVPDFKNTISQFGSPANMEPPMTPKSDIHTCLYILYMGCYPEQGTGDFWWSWEESDSYVGIAVHDHYSPLETMFICIIHFGPPEKYLQSSRYNSSSVGRRSRPRDSRFSRLLHRFFPGRPKWNI